jgi:molybdate transport system permease protein
LRRALFGALTFGAAALALVFLVLPVAAIFLRVPPGKLVHQLSSPIVTDALIVSAKTTAIAQLLILLFGTPLAYLVASRRFRGRSFVVTLIELPLVLPPAVAGIGLLAAVGTGGLFGSTLRDAGIELPFTEAAVVLAVAFVASPFYIRQAISAFESVDPNLTDAARTLGAGPGRTFWRIGLPLAASGLLAGWVLAFARGVGEFGATIIFAGNVRGQTQTLTLTIYEQLESSLDVALAIGVLLVVLSGGVLLSYKMLSSWRRSTSRSPSPFARSSSASA